MTRRFRTAAAISAVLLAGLLSAATLAGVVDPREQHVNLADGFHLSLTARTLEDPRIVFFSDARYGPYCGSTVGVVGDPNGPETRWFGDSAGICFRHFRWPNGTVFWTLSLSLFYPIAIASVLPVAWVVRRGRRVRHGFHRILVDSCVRRRPPL